MSPSQLSSSSAIASLLLDNKQETHPDWEEKHPPAPSQPAITDTTITSSPSVSRTRNPSSVSFSLSSPSPSSLSSSGRTERHRRRRAQRGSPTSSPIFTPAELEAQKAKRSSWLQQNQTTLQQQRDLARKEKERQGNRWLVGVLLLWLVVITVIVVCVGRSLWAGQGRQQARLKATEAWRQSASRVQQPERITSMLEQDW